MWVASTEECREIDRRFAPDASDADHLIERAGHAVSTYLQAHLKPNSNVLFLCGPGHNGADGFAAALYSLKQGFATVAVPVWPNGSAKLLCSTWRERYEREGGIVAPAVPDQRFAFIVDAILGVGSRPLQAEVEAIVSTAATMGAPILAVDVPTGLDADSGTATRALHADVTVAMIAAKRGFFVGDGPDVVGDTIVETLGLPNGSIGEVATAFVPETLWLAQRLPPRSGNAHKANAGSVSLVAGCRETPGATFLAALGAFRAGAGLVGLEPCSPVREFVTTLLPEIVVRDLGESAVCVIGPGLGLEKDSEMRARAGIERAARVVLDADALTMLAECRLHATIDIVLTPHPGEAGRLLGTSTADVQSDRFGSVRAIAERYRAVCVLKGRHTLVAGTQRHTAVVPYGNPGMATAGSGDVLAGAVAALWSKGTGAFDASVCAACMHGIAGDLCSAEIGSQGFLAREIADRMPAARDKLRPS